jgi:hypothetical protein
MEVMLNTHLKVFVLGFERCEATAAAVTDVICII